MKIGERCYPKSIIACVIVYLLDRLPEKVLDQVLDSYWSPEDIERVKREGKRMYELFGKKDG